MKHRVSFVITCWWLIVLLGVGGFMLAYAPRDARVSEKENRMLTGMPDASVSNVMNGEFMQGFEDWLSDGFFSRDSVISVSKTLLSSVAFGNTEEDIEDRLKDELTEEAEAEREAKELEAQEEAQEEAAVEEIAETAETEAEPAAQQETVFEEEAEEIEADEEMYEDELSEAGNEEGVVDFDLNGKITFYLKMTNGKIERLYTYSQKNVQTVANMLNAYRDALGEGGTVHYMQIPFSGNAYRWTANRATYCGWGSNVEDYIREKVNDGVYIHNIPELFEDELEAGEYLYFRLDHHWTPKAAWMAVTEMMRVQGYPTVDYDEYDYTVYKDFYGSHYDPNDMDRMHRLVDTLEIMHPILPGKHYLVTKLTKLNETSMMAYNRKSYTAYMRGTLGPWRLIETGFNTGRTALVICDSFGTTFTPFLLPYYDTVLVTDLRPDYYNKDDAGASVRKYIRQYGVNDVYMVMSTVSGPARQYSLSYMMKYLD